MNTQAPQQPDIILQKEADFNPISEKFSREELIDSIKTPYRKRTKALLDSIDSDDSFSIDPTTGQLLHNSTNIGKLSELLSDLWDRKKKGENSVQSFIKILHNAGLSRFIPKSKSVKVDQATFVNSPFNVDKWYFIGQ